MSNHSIEQEEIMAYLDGELSADRSLTALSHLEHCPECQDLAADLRVVSQQLAWEVGSSGPRMVSEIESALEERLREPRETASLKGTALRNSLTMRRWAWAGSLAVACAVVGLGVTLSTFNRETNRLARENGLPAPVVAPPAAAAPAMSVGQFDKLQQFAKLQNPPKVGFKAPDAAAPMIARTAALTLTTKDFQNARSALDDILRRHRGYIGELTVNTATGAARTFSATLRVPADQLEVTIADLRKLGRVELESQNGEEVTAQYVDLEARLSNARNTEQRLTDLLRQRTGKLSDVLAVETELARVRGEIESMEAERKTLAKRVDFATINATVSEDYKEQLQVMPESTAGRLRNAAVEGYRTMVDAIISLFLFLFSYGPSILLWAGLLYFPARAIWKRFARPADR